MWFWYFIEAYRMMMEILVNSQLLEMTVYQFLTVDWKEYYRTASILTFGGGTNEVQRDIISMAGLLMPRSR